MRPAARAVVLRRARRLGCGAWELGRTFDWRERRDGTIAVELPGLDLDRLRVRRIGGFQRDNAAVALAASWLLASGEGIGPAAFAAAAAKALPASRWPGRWCPLPLRKNAGAWVDGGHNPEAASALAREISGVPPWVGGRRLVALWSMLSDKDATGYLRNLGRHFDGIVTYPLSHPRGAGTGGARRSVRKPGDRLPPRGGLPGRMADRAPVGREGGRRARVRLARRRGRRLPAPRRFRPLNPLRRIVICLLLIVGAVSDVSAEARFPNPSALKELSKPGIRLDAPVRMTADTLSYDEETGVAVAEGNVEVAFGTRTMRADRVRYDSTTGEADLSGKVRYKDADEEFAFDRITINLDSETGVLYNGTIRISSSNYLIASQKIEKTGKSSFLIEKGTLTTCPCDPEPDWKFEVRRARVTLDKYAVGKDITFRVRGVPVLWVPWGAFPVKMTRQSGLLLPNFSSNRSRGYSLQVPYYQVINRWSDATVTFDG